MIVKKFEGLSQDALMPEIFKEMGEDAVILSVVEKKPSGISRLFSKPKVIVTAACEDTPINKPKPTRPKVEPLPALVEKNENEDLGESLSLLVQEARKATKIQEEMEKPKTEKKQPTGKIEKKEPVPSTTETETEMSPSVQKIYDILISQDVMPSIAYYLLGDLKKAREADVKDLMKTIYTNIMNKLGSPNLINTNSPQKLQVVAFMGPTGVGKTTTIAKIASTLKLKHNMRVGLITADTYRIAAVEQLRTYADILGLELKITYSPEDLSRCIDLLEESSDVILIDTAGRSHRDESNLNELKHLLSYLPDESKHYLLLSANTQYISLKNTIESYETFSDFSIIFTKLDEAENLGTIMNICCMHGKKPSYVTFGQNVPDDFSVVEPDKIAKSILGLDSGIYGSQEEVDSEEI